MISCVILVILNSPINSSPLIPELPLLSELPDIGSMLGSAPSLLQTTVGTVTTGPQVGGNVVTNVPAVTTVPVVLEPPMTAVLPVIFAVAVIKALVLGEF